MAALNRRDIAVDRVQGTYRALAQVCLGERARRGTRERSADSAGESSAETGQQAMILLLVQPDSLAGLPVMIDAVDRYAPHTVWWAYEPKAQPQLRAVSTDELRKRITPPKPIEPGVQTGQVTPQGIVWSSQTSESASSSRVVGRDLPLRAKSPPVLRLSGEGAPLSEPKTDSQIEADQPPTNIRQMLSEEELAMLLAEDFSIDEGVEDFS